MIFFSTTVMELTGEKNLPKQTFSTGRGLRSILSLYFSQKRVIALLTIILDPWNNFFKFELKLNSGISVTQKAGHHSNTLTQLDGLHIDIWGSLQERSAYLILEREYFLKRNVLRTAAIWNRYTQSSRLQTGLQGCMSLCFILVNYWSGKILSLRSEKDLGICCLVGDTGCSLFLLWLLLNSLCLRLLEVLGAGALTHGWHSKYNH